MSSYSPVKALPNTAVVTRPIQPTEAIPASQYDFGLIIIPRSKSLEFASTERTDSLHVSGFIGLLQLCKRRCRPYIRFNRNSVVIPRYSVVSVSQTTTRAILHTRTHTHTHIHTHGHTNTHTHVHVVHIIQYT